MKIFQVLNLNKFCYEQGRSSGFVTEAQTEQAFSSPREEGPLGLLSLRNFDAGLVENLFSVKSPVSACSSLSLDYFSGYIAMNAHTGLIIFVIFLNANLF